MRKSQVLYQQHIGRMFQWHWRVQKKRTVTPTGAIPALKHKGLQTVKAEDILQRDPVLPPPVKEVIQYPGSMVKKFERPSDHPHYHEEPCLIFGDSNVLIEGLNQAMVFTNSVQVSETSLPFQQGTYDKENHNQKHKLVRRAIKSSLLFDAHQEKLSKKTDPERPAWNFPRDYGTTDFRRNRLLCNRLIQLCSNFSPSKASTLKVLNRGEFQVPVTIDGSKVLMLLRADTLLLSQEAPKPFLPPSASGDYSLPDISPLSPIISIEGSRIYDFTNFFPVPHGITPDNIHLAVVHYNETEVSNLHDSPVKENQVLGRTLLKNFAFACAQARRKFGDDVTDLPVPQVVQTIQTDGRVFHFTVFQLNSTSTESSCRNMFWQLPPLHLFASCDYVKGVPTLTEYDPQVLKWLLTFYNNF